MNKLTDFESFESAAAWIKAENDRMYGNARTTLNEMGQEMVIASLLDSLNSLNMSLTLANDPDTREISLHYLNRARENLIEMLGFNKTEEGK